MTASPRVVAGRFALDRLLGTGGSATVFAARDLRTGADVALKVLHPHLAERTIAREAFLAEARRVAGLRHPNIVGVRDAGVDDDGDAPVVWIALDRAPGVTLSQHVARHSALRPAAAVQVIDGVLRALEAVHAAGLIHRDVSPSNVSVVPTSTGRIEASGVRLLDFGLADAVGSAALATDDLLNADATGRDGVIGNVNYMSPEHVRGDPVDERGDVYQAGALLFFALTGKAPFARDTVEETLQAHLLAPVPAPSTISPLVPRVIDRVVRRALLKAPEERFASATAMREVLAAVALSPDGSDPTVRVVVSGAPDGSSPTRVLPRTTTPSPAGSVRGPSGGAAPGRRSLDRSRAHARGRAGGVVVAASAVVLLGAVVFSAASATPTSSFVAVAEPTGQAAPVPFETAAPAETGAPPAPDTRAPVPPADDPATLVAVPDLAGVTLIEALRVLDEAGLVSGDAVGADSPLPRDTVLASHPAAGVSLSPGSAVVLTIASGSNAIPDISGEAREAASAALAAAGFLVRFERLDASHPGPPATVVGSAPGPGIVQTVGSLVTLFETPPAVPSTSPDPVSTAGPSPSPPATPPPPVVP